MAHVATKILAGGLIVGAMVVGAFAIPALTSNPQASAAHGERKRGWIFSGFEEDSDPKVKRNPTVLTIRPTSPTAGQTGGEEFTLPEVQGGESPAAQAEVEAEDGGPTSEDQAQAETDVEIGGES